MGALDKHIAMNTDHPSVMMEMKTDTNKHTTINKKTLYGNIMPDVTGMGLRDAIYMLENSGMQVQVQGKGKVKQQSVPAGTRITKGQNIIIQLS
jgi:cell division protein FtsI (penicillin-binding protein 3)